MEQKPQTNLTQWELIDNWIKSSQTRLIDMSDVGREGVIINLEFKNTKYGARLLITIDFGTEKKGFFAGKKFAQSIIAQVGSSEKLIGKRVKVVGAKYITTNGQLKDMAIIELQK